MPAEPPITDDLLDPISTSQPAGADMRWTPEWDRIKEARRFDDALETGKWEKRERKAADWRLVRELASAMLRDRTKDLQLAMWLTEANTKMHGFTGLSEGLRITRELMERFWDKGLYPSIEDGAEDRAGPFEWLNNKLVDSIVAIPITVRADQGQDFGFIDLQDAKRLGSDAGNTENGEIDSKKKKAFDQAIADGHVSLEMFERAVRETRRAGYEELNANFQRTYNEFKALEKTVDEKFGVVAPSLASCRSALGDMQQAISDILAAKRRAEPDAQPAGNTAGAETGAAPVDLRAGSSLLNLQGRHSDMNGSWQEAETLVRSGQVERGLVEMTRLAASETCGRNRFERKLLLAEVCIKSDRERIARLILEELAEQIDKFQLEFWESSELISSVWSRLYRIYKRSAIEDDVERSGKLYERLCRLDPWQALGAEKG